MVRPSVPSRSITCTSAAPLARNRSPRPVTRISGTPSPVSCCLRTDYRYLNLRDNDSLGPDLFDAVGLLFDDYREKQAFGAYRRAIERYGTAAPATAGGGAGG